MGKSPKFMQMKHLQRLQRLTHIVYLLVLGGGSYATTVQLRRIVGSEYDSFVTSANKATHSCLIATTKRRNVDAIEKIMN